MIREFKIAHYSGFHTTIKADSLKDVIDMMGAENTLRWVAPSDGWDIRIADRGVEYFFRLK